MASNLVITCLSALLNVLSWVLPAPYNGIASGLVAVLAGLSSLSAGSATASGLTTQKQGLHLVPPPPQPQPESERPDAGWTAEEQQGRP